MTAASTGKSASPIPEPKRTVLHVISSLSKGGIETWLMHMFRQAQGFSVRHAVLLIGDGIGDYENEARTLGVEIHRLPLRGGRLMWPFRFRAFLKTHQEIAAVHAHCLPHFNAAACALARSAGIELQISHSHSARSQGNDLSFRLRTLTRFAQPVGRAVASDLVGISEPAIAELAGENWQACDKTKILLYGFDFSPFYGAQDRGRQIRSDLGISETAYVVGCVGRFVAVKNHELLINAFAELYAEEPNAVLVLVGEGPLEQELRESVNALPVRDAVIFGGTTSDVAAYMAAFDLFCLPSHSEGLGIVCIEAQAAGTPSLISDTFPREVEIIEEGVVRLSLQAGAKAWARVMAATLEQGRAPDPDEWLARVEQSRFGLARCVAELDEIYSRKRPSGIASGKP